MKDDGSNAKDQIPKKDQGTMFKERADMTGHETHGGVGHLKPDP